MKKLIVGGIAAALMVAPFLQVHQAYADPFLCPIVGDGVLNADAHNGSGGVVAISPPAGTSLLPGNNQVEANANANAYNEFGGPITGNTPGTPGFTPIWNP